MPSKKQAKVVKKGKDTKAQAQHNALLALLKKTEDKVNKCLKEDKKQEVEDADGETATNNKDFTKMRNLLAYRASDRCVKALLIRALLTHTRATHYIHTHTHIYIYMIITPTYLVNNASCRGCNIHLAEDAYTPAPI